MTLKKVFLLFSDFQRHHYSLAQLPKFSTRCLIGSVELNSSVEYHSMDSQSGMEMDL